MQWFDQVTEYVRNLGIYTGTIKWGDWVEIIIIAFLLYYILRWMKNTRAWSLMRGLIVIAAFLLIANIMGMTTILWLSSNVLSFAVTALIIVLQPELRKALEDLGKKNFIGGFIGFDNRRADDELSDRTINEPVKACAEMAKVKTGALIVIENSESLSQIEETGIAVDGVVSSQLLINIFENNTPLHDGAVIVRGNRVAAATCYLPLTDSMTLSKDLGTRHRAGLGVSEAYDCYTIIVSEETGGISLATEGKLETGLDGDKLRLRLHTILNREEAENAGRKIGRRRRKG